jgi:hypothetical protein
VDDTTFSLEVENKDEVVAISSVASNKSLSNLSVTNSNDSLDSNQSEVTNFKSKRQMFEFNFEIRFTNKEIK